MDIVNNNVTRCQARCDTYMKEETLDKTDGFMRLKDDIQSLYKILLKG